MTGSPAIQPHYILVLRTIESIESIGENNGHVNVVAHPRRRLEFHFKKTPTRGLQIRKFLENFKSHISHASVKFFPHYKSADKTRGTIDLRLLCGIFLFIIHKYISINNLYKFTTF